MTTPSENFIYYSYWAQEFVSDPGKKIFQMTKEEFISEYSMLARNVINAEKMTPLEPFQKQLLDEGKWKEFSFARDYTLTQIKEYQRLLYLMGRERRPQFLVEGSPYTFSNIPLSYFGGAPRPCPEWLWHQWQIDQSIPEALYS